MEQEKEIRPNFDELNDVDIADEKEEKDAIKIDESESKGPREVLGLKLPDDNVVDKAKLKLSILRYRETFGKYLEHYGDRLEISNLEALSNEELGILLEDVKIAVGCRRTASLIPPVYFGLAGMVEGFGSTIGMELQGLQTALMNNQMIVETLQEISLEYESISYLPPVQRLLIGTGQIIVSLHSINKSNRETKIFSEKPIKKEVVDEFKDI